MTQDEQINLMSYMCDRWKASFTENAILKAILQTELSPDEVSRILAKAKDLPEPRATVDRLFLNLEAAIQQLDEQRLQQRMKDIPQGLIH